MAGRPNDRKRLSGRPDEPSAAVPGDTEQASPSEADHSCKFTQTEGDFTSYEGSWAFEGDASCTTARLIVTYEYKVPLIGALIQGLLQKKVQQNCQSMLDAIKAKAESA